MKDSDRPVPAVAPATQADADAAAGSRLRDQVRHSPLLVNLIRLSDGRTLEVSDAFVTFAGMDRESLLSKPVADYTEEPEIALASFALLASGALDGYTRKASFRRPDGEVVTATSSSEQPTHNGGSTGSPAQMTRCWPTHPSRYWAAPRSPAFTRRMSVTSCCWPRTPRPATAGRLDEFGLLPVTEDG